MDCSVSVSRSGCSGLDCHALRASCFEAVGGEGEIVLGFLDLAAQGHDVGCRGEDIHELGILHRRVALIEGGDPGVYLGGERELLGLHPLPLLLALSHLRPDGREVLLGLVGVGRGRLEGRAGVLHRLRELLLDLCRLLAVEELEDVVAVGGDGVLGRLDARGERLKVGLLALERIGEQLEVGLGFHTLLVHFVQPFLTLVPLVVKFGDVIPEQLVVRAYQAAPVGYRQELFEVGVELVGILGVAAQIVCDGGEVALIGAFLHEEACVAGAELCDAPGERLYLARVALYVGVALVVFVELAACLLHGAVGILRELDYHDTAGVGVDIGRAVGECLVEGHIAFPFLAVALYTLLCVGEFVAQVVQAFLVGALGVAHGVIALLVGVIFLAGLVAVALGIAYHFVEDSASA